MSFRDATAELVYHVWETFSPLAARALFLATRPALYHQLHYQSCKITPLGAGFWQVKGMYGKVQNRYAIKISTKCEKGKRLHALETIRSYNCEVTAADAAADPSVDEGPDFKGLIGVSDNKVDGVDVYVRAFKMQIDWSSKDGTLDPSYIELVDEMGAHTNSVGIALTWRGQQLFFPPNSLLFLGADFNETSDDGCSISMSFERNMPETGIVVGERDDIDKEGWHYLWIKTAKRRDEDIGAMIEVPTSANIEKVYELAEFTDLGIFDLIESSEDEVDDLLDEEQEEEES